jgi:monothiol glutaredoxin
MELAPETRDRIDRLISNDRVVLFMKGTRQGPQCGFSATVVQILDRLVPTYSTVDVLSDPEIRDGIKTFSSWPTIPQLYVGGEFVGGCDIIQEMFSAGELHETLGVRAVSGAPPTLHITDPAAAALRQLSESSGGGRPLHLAIDARFQAGLFFAPPEDGELQVEANGIVLAMDPLSASRAEGLRIDARETDDGPAFSLDNPNAPTVHQLTVGELAALLASGEAFEFLDVRTPEEREKARIEGTVLLDPEKRAALEKLDLDTRLVFHCHHGGRSQKAAEHFAFLGFRNVHNVVGGIDAWSLEVDADVPRY